MYSPTVCDLQLDLQVDVANSNQVFLAATHLFSRVLIAPTTLNPRSMSVLMVATAIKPVAPVTRTVDGAETAGITGLVPEYVIERAKSSAEV